MCDNRCQLFHRENYKKEEFLRMKWFLKNQQKLIDNLGIAKSTIQSKIKSKEKELPKKDEIEPKVLYQLIFYANVIYIYIIVT